MPRSFLLLLLLVSCLLQTANAQLGGSRAFEFLNIPQNSRLAALGGTNITSGWEDVAVIGSNPALLNESWHNKLAINRLGYFADINQTSLSYARTLKSGVWAVNLAYFDYGEIESFDAVGFPNGQFEAAEFALAVSHSRAFGPFRWGISARFASSDISSFGASALMFDVGGVFKHPEKDLTVGMVVKNLGFFLSDYTEVSQSELPMDVQLGVTYKPEFMPFRFSLTARNLNRSDVVFFDPATNSLNGQTDDSSLSEEIFRRLVLGVELMIHPNFQFRAGYNHLLRQELKQENASGGAGFSFGLMFKVKRFEFGYSRALYHTAGGSNTLQLTTDLTGFLKKTN